MFLLFILLILITTTTTTPHCSPSTTPKPYSNCLTLPTQDASLAWTYHPHNATVDLLFTGSFISPSGWVSFGINPLSLSMSGTFALISFPHPSSSSLLLLPFLLDPSVKLQLSPLLSTSLPSPFLPSSSSASLLHSPSIRPHALLRISSSLSLAPNRTRINLIWNRGLYVQSFSPTIHPTTPADLASRASIDLLSSSAQFSPPYPPFFPPFHASINAFSWGFLIPVAAFVARYLRHWPCMNPGWFYLHVTAQVVAVMIGFVGFGIGVDMGRGDYVLHRRLGIAVVIAGGLQVVGGFLRPGTAHRWRKYWKWYHRLVGYGLVVVGVVNVFVGMEVMGLGGSYVELGYCLGMGTMGGVCVALEVNGWVMFYRRRAEEEKV